MDTASLFKLYEKERDYQKCCFGEYSEIDSLNLASFILFIENYIERTKKSYCEKWDDCLPEWFINSKEMKGGSAPVTAYEELIKVFVLTGAALETFLNVDVEEWRRNLHEEVIKWKK